MGLPGGNMVRAMRSLMMATCCEVAVSCGPKVTAGKERNLHGGEVAVADDVMVNVDV